MRIFSLLLFFHVFNVFASIDKDRWKSIINLIINDIYKDKLLEIATNRKVNVWVSYAWESNSVNAEARNYFYSSPNYKHDALHFIFYGGLARIEKINDLGFAAAVCHELGHHLGGPPFKQNTLFSTEGQADYFSAGCIIKYLRRSYYPEDIILSTAFMAAYNLHNSIFLMKGMGVLNMKVNTQLPPFKHILNKGIDQDYPTAECRLLTLYNAIYKMSRPKCWYNPKIDI